jgi:adenosyl cobinamide kinase/adenosyl cobinamide phosphate guanylyltransferase
MILVVGGFAAGKREFIKSEYGYGDGDIADAVLDDRPVLSALHNWARENSAEDGALFERLLQKDVVICDEVGCGVVPIDPAERKWRDDVGRLCARLAARADRVVRVVCGVPTVIKG